MKGHSIMTVEKTRGVLTGPVELRDYDFITLCEEHEVVLPNGTTLRLPPGTKLVLLARGGGGIGLRYEKGTVASRQGPLTPSA
jgi:hypothetical protein